MSIAVIIPAYNEEKFIGPCLDALMNQSVKPDEIIVVDNNCVDNTVEIAKKYPVKIVKQPIQGMTPARNKGFDTATSDIIAKCDADTRVGKEWVATLLREFKDETVVAVSGTVDYYDSSMPSFLTRWLIEVYRVCMELLNGHHIVLGGQYALRSVIWKTVRKEICLDDKKVHEDIDISYHMAPHGKILWLTDLPAKTSFRRYTQWAFYTSYPWRAITTWLAHSNNRV